MRLGQWIVVVGCCSGVLPVSVAQGQWARCASDLELLESAAAEAREASADVSMNRQWLLAQREAFERCRGQGQSQIDTQGGATAPTPRVFGGDDCLQHEMSYQSYRLGFSTALDQAREAFASLATAVQTVEASCQFPLARLAPVVEQETRSPACESFLRRRPDAPVTALRVICPTEMSAEACAACLGEP